MLHCLNQMNFPMLSVAHDIISRDNTVPVTTHEIKHSSWKKIKNGGSTVQLKQEHYTQVFQFLVLPAEDISRPTVHPPLSDSENPTASPLLMSPHICLELTGSLCSLKGAWALVLKFFSQMYNVVQEGGKRMVLVTLNECSKVAERYRSNAKPQRCSFPSTAHFQCLRVTSLAITDRCPQDYFLTCGACFPIADNPH